MAHANQPESSPGEPALGPSRQVIQVDGVRCISNRDFNRDEGGEIPDPGSAGLFSPPEIAWDRLGWIRSPWVQYIRDCDSSGTSNKRHPRGLNFSAQPTHSHR